MSDTSGRPCVVILTGGALPMSDPDGPHPHEIELALERSGAAAIPDALEAHLARRIAGEAFLVGWHAAAKEHRVVQVYVIDDGPEAARFAEFITREVDPAYVRRAASPVAELLAAWEDQRRREEQHRDADEGAGHGTAAADA